MHLVVWPYISYSLEFISCQWVEHTRKWNECSQWTMTSQLSWETGSAAKNVILLFGMSTIRNGVVHEILGTLMMHGHWWVHYAVVLLESPGLEYGYERGNLDSDISEIENVNQLCSWESQPCQDLILWIWEFLNWEWRQDTPRFFGQCPSWLFVYLLVFHIWYSCHYGKIKSHVRMNQMMEFAFCWAVKHSW